MTNETWKDVPNFDGKYQINNKGDIRHKDRLDKYLKPAKNRKGYLTVGLWGNHKGNTFRVHRLVAQVFIPNPENKPQINHINGIKTDNRVENLEWVNNSENVRHADKLGLRRCVKGEKHYMCKLSETDIEAIRKSYIFRHPEFGTVALAKKYGVSQQHISNILNNRKRVNNEQKSTLRRPFL